MKNGAYYLLGVSTKILIEAKKLKYIFKTRKKTKVYYFHITSTFNKMSENTEQFSSNALVEVSNECTSNPIGSTKSASKTKSDNDNTPRIICNELIVNPQKSKSIEKLDELSSLEREIAKMHHVDDTHVDLDGSSARLEKKQEQTIVAKPVILSTDGNNSNEKESNDISTSINTSIEEKLNAITSGETALEHEDLIAVLKGLDGNNDETQNNSGSGSLLDGVTIEGEGEYQIMEVIDEDSNATDDNAKPSGAPSTVEPIVQTLNKRKTFGATALTIEEERALALEQIEGLKSAHRRRKQDIKPIKQIDPALDLVSSLEAEWSEHEEELNENIKSQAKTKQPGYKNKTVSSTTSVDKANSPLITSVVVLPSVVTATVSSAPMPVAASTANTIPSVAVSTGNSEEKLTSKISSANDVIDTKVQHDTQSSSIQSGFRRTRVIKRKIIWDPDAPETTISYAKLAKSNSYSKTKIEPTSTSPFQRETTSASLTTTKRITRPTTPKAKKNFLDLNIQKTGVAKLEKISAMKNIAEKEVLNSENKGGDDHTRASIASENKSSATASVPPKRRSQTPLFNGPGPTGGVKKKKITEVDRLMGDEGAVNMLNSLEKLEATLGSGDIKPSRPMMRSRAATISEKFPRKDTSPVQSTTATTPAATNSHSNKGKRTPKSRASSSWDYVYKKKKQNFEDSLIIRRRSNSSYSSTTSQNRLSLDGPPASIASSVSNSSTNCNDSTPIPAPRNENYLLKQSPSTSSTAKSSSSSKSRSTPTPPASKSFEFAKPESKKSQKRIKSPAATLTTDMKKATPAANKRNVRSPATANEDKNKDVIKTSSTKSPVNMKDKKDSALSSTTTSDVVVKKSYKVAQILFSSNKAKLSNTFTMQMLNKLVDILDKLALDPDCHVVVIGTNDAHFCQGIDITDLTTLSDEKRKIYAVNLATSVKNYLKTLATYPKPIVGGVNGNLINLGVIQLALFDVVIASDKTTFETPYAKMGQTPEGFCIWHNMNKIRGSFKTKLFWLCEKVQSTEAALAGLVNKLTSGNKVNDDALMAAKRIASLSAESYRVMKKTVINSHLDVIVNSLDEEFNAIAKQWSSSECLDNLKKYIGQK